MINQQYKLVEPFVVESFFQDVKVTGTEHLVVRPRKLSICKADIRYYFGIRDAEVLKKRLPMVLIHEACGEVLYDPTGEYRRGDKVVLLPNIPGKDTFYKENYRLDSLFRSSREDGFLQELLRINKSQIVPYNCKGNDDVFSFTELISVGVHIVDSFLEHSHNRRDRIAVWGDGAVSFIVCCVLRNRLPNAHITVLGLNPNKLQYFNFLDDVLNVNQLESVSQFDHVFECVGGAASGKAINQMIDTVLPQGSMILAGVSEEPVPINTRMVLEKGLTMIGRSRSGHRDFEAAVDLLENDDIFAARMQQIISDKIDVSTINDISRAFELAKSADFKIVVNWNI